jgi:cytochrome c553
MMRMRVRGARQIACHVLASLCFVHFPVIAGAQSLPGSVLAQQNWVLNCMGCHTQGAVGVAGKIPPLANSLGYFEHLPQGREYVIRVPGASNSALSDQELADVLNWLLVTLNSSALPKDFKPYTAQEITAHRRPALTNVARERSTLVRALRQRGITGIRDPY